MHASSYIANNDFEGALERFKNTTKRWRNHWWDTLKTIYNNCAEWAKKYTLDPVKKLVYLIKYPQIKWSCEIPTNPCGAYLVKHYCGTNFCWKKVGKANNVHKRLKEHFRKDYPGQVDRCEVIAFYPCESADMALTMENVMRDYFRRKSPLLGNDRFLNGEITKQDLAVLAKKYQAVKELFDEKYAEQWRIF